MREYRGFSPFRVEKLSAEQTDEGVCHAHLIRHSFVVTPFHQPGKALDVRTEGAVKKVLSF